MKNLFILLAFLMTVSLYGQDPGLLNPILESNPWQPNEVEKAKFTFANLSGGDIPDASDLKVVISFTGGDPTGPPTGAGAVFFDWVYSAASNAYQGTANQAIPEGEGGEIIFDVTVTGAVGETGGFNANLQIPASFVGNTVGNDSQGLFATIQTALPVDLTSFKFSDKDCEFTTLDWVTASEINNHGFYIERRTLSSGGYENVGFVEAKENATSYNSYSFVDDLSDVKDKSEIYYRLKQVDLDGKEDVSDAIVVRNRDCEQIEVALFPNPARSFTNIALEGWDTESSFDYTIINVAGISVSEKEIKGSNEAKLDLKNLAPGVYKVVVRYKNESYTKSFIKIQ